jgi:hypothetical protein
LKQGLLIIVVKAFIIFGRGYKLKLIDGRAGRKRREVNLVVGGLR